MGDEQFYAKSIVGLVVLEALFYWVGSREVMGQGGGRHEKKLDSVFNLHFIYFLPFLKTSVNIPPVILPKNISTLFLYTVNRCTQITLDFLNF